MKFENPKVWNAQWTACLCWDTINLFRTFQNYELYNDQKRTSKS